MSDAEKLRLATKAIKYTLGRAQTDADLGYLIGPMMETFRLLCEAEAAIDGRDVEVVTSQRSKSLARQPRQYLTRAEWEQEQETERERQRRAGD